MYSVTIRLGPLSTMSILRFDENKGRGWWLPGGAWSSGCLVKWLSVVAWSSGCPQQAPKNSVDVAVLS